MDLYKKMNQPGYQRTKGKMTELIKPWKIMEPGFLDLEKWHNLPTDIGQQYVDFAGGGGGYYGGILIK